ncbi:MAG TPA: DotI/IcmL family type IV secretion protein [Legionella sp.]|nr:DotI/IcmL family type IV secretion protein [Legionella sp.]
MSSRASFLSVILLLITFQTGHTAPDRTQLVVWAHEAIIAAYTFNYKTFTQDQRGIARYFTAPGWISFNRALTDSKLPEVVQKNAYDVTAVATQPPRLITLDPTHWQVIMPILVVYKNPQFQQQQNLRVILSFTQAPPNRGVRGFNASSLQSVVITPPCHCPVEQEQQTTASP